MSEANIYQSPSEAAWDNYELNKQRTESIALFTTCRSGTTPKTREGEPIPLSLEAEHTYSEDRATGGETHAFELRLRPALKAAELVVVKATTDAGSLRSGNITYTIVDPQALAERVEVGEDLGTASINPSWFLEPLRSTGLELVDVDNRVFRGRIEEAAGAALLLEGALEMIEAEHDRDTIVTKYETSHPDRYFLYRREKKTEREGHRVTKDELTIEYLNAETEFNVEEKLTAEAVQGEAGVEIVLLEHEEAKQPGYTLSGQVVRILRSADFRGRLSASHHVRLRDTKRPTDHSLRIVNQKMLDIFVEHMMQPIDASGVPTV